MFNKEPLIFMSLLGAVGYVTFHGHSVGKDCWLCPYRGLAFAGSSVGLGVWLAFQEKE
jgi:hypothetical protein